jgi:hypothetical protein
MMNDSNGLSNDDIFPVRVEIHIIDEEIKNKCEKTEEISLSA